MLRPSKGNNDITNYRNSESQQRHCDGSIERKPRCMIIANSDVLWYWYLAVQNLSTHPIFLYLSLS
jgi:hypothetical protein